MNTPPDPRPSKTSDQSNPTAQVGVRGQRRMTKAATPAVKAGGRTPATGTGRSLSSSSLFRILRALLVLVALIAGVAGAIVLSSTSDSLADISRGTQQVLRLQTIKGDVLRSDGTALNGLAQGADEPLSQRESYRNCLQDAARLTVEASRAEPRDQSGLAEINASLVTYVATLELGRATMPSDSAAAAITIQAANQVLRESVLPTIDELVQVNQQRIDSARSINRGWVVLLAAVPVILVIATSIVLARRTRRVLNLGLLVALVASAGLWFLVDSNLGSTNRVVDDTRAGSLQNALSSAQAYAQLANAKSLEGHQLLQPGRAGNLETQWTDAMASVDTEVAQLSVRAGELKTEVTAYRTAHIALNGLVTAGKTAEARTAAGSTASAAVNPTFSKAATSLNTIVDETRAQTAEGMTAQQGRLDIVIVITVLLGLAAAVAAGLGISTRLEDFR